MSDDIVHLNFGGDVNLCGVPKRTGLGPLEDTDPALLCRTCWRLSTIQRRERDAKNQEVFASLRRDNIDLRLALLRSRAHLAEVNLGVLMLGNALTKLVPHTTEEAAVEIRKMAAFAGSLREAAGENKAEVVAGLREWWSAHVADPELLTTEQAEELTQIAGVLGVALQGPEVKP